MAMSLARRAQGGANKTQLLTQTARRRALLIIGIGILLNGFPFATTSPRCACPACCSAWPVHAVRGAGSRIWCGPRGLWGCPGRSVCLRPCVALQLGVLAPDAEGVVRQASPAAGAGRGRLADPRAFGPNHFWSQAHPGP